MALGRRRRRSIRRVDPISVLKTSLLLYTGLALTFGTALLILWNVARGGGLITRLENGIKNSGGLASFEFDSLFVFKISGALLVLWVFVGSAANVLAAVLYNLTADVVGGLQITVLEEVPQSTAKVSEPDSVTRVSDERLTGTQGAFAGSSSTGRTTATNASSKPPPRNTPPSGSKHGRP